MYARCADVVASVIIPTNLDVLSEKCFPFWDVGPETSANCVYNLTTCGLQFADFNTTTPVVTPHN